MKLRWEKKGPGKDESWWAYSGELVIGMVGYVDERFRGDNGPVFYKQTEVRMKYIGKGSGHVSSISAGKRAIERGWRQWLTAAGLDTWFDIADLPDDDNALVVAGSFNRDGEWCAEVATPRYLRENQEKIASGFFKGSEHLVWAHTHWIYLATPPKAGA